MAGFSSREVQFGSLIDLEEELELATAPTRTSSTPLQAAPTIEIAGLTRAVEALVSKIERSDGETARRLDEITMRLETVENAVPRDPCATSPDLAQRASSEEKDELMLTLEEIAARVSGIVPGSGQEQGKPKVRPTTFDGTAAWEDYLAQFEIVAEINQWDDRTKATHLAVSLSGPAREVLGDLASPERRDFRTLTQALATRFGTENRTEMFRASIKSRTRQRNESLPEMAQAFRRLARHAYPQASAELREVLARDHFVDALGDIDTKWKIKQARPDTLSQALDIAVELEAFQLANTQRVLPQSRVVQVAGTEKDLAAEVAELKEQLRKVQAQDRRRREGCYTCGALDHYRRECPEANRQDSSTFQQPGRQRQRQQLGGRQHQQNQTGRCQQTGEPQNQAVGNENLPGSSP